VDFGKGSLWVISTDGSSQHEIASTTYDPEDTSSPRFLRFAVWNPKGQEVAYDVGKALFVVKVETGEHRQVYESQALTGIRVVQWFSDGSEIAFLGSVVQPELWKLQDLLGESK